MEKRSFEKEKNFISVVVYVRNVQASIQAFLKQIDTVIGANFESYEYVIVNDASEDDSVKQVKEITSQIGGNISVVNLAWKHGLEVAMLAGTDVAIGDFVFEFDTTIVNYDLSLILHIYETCLKGYDVVAAAEAKNKRTSSKLFYNYLNKISYRKMELTTETFRIISRRIINRVSTNKQKVRYRKALYHYSGFNTKVEFYQPVNNLSLENDLKLDEKFGLGLDVLIGHSNLGTRIAGYISALFLVFAILSGVYAGVSFITIKDIAPGWTTTMVFLSASFTGVFFVLFIISKYLTTILVEIQERPIYVFKSLEKLQK